MCAVNKIVGKSMNQAVSGLRRGKLYYKGHPRAPNGRSVLTPSLVAPRPFSNILN